MKLKNKNFLLLSTFCVFFADAKLQETTEVTDSIIEIQRTRLAKATMNKGFGPQSPRDIDNKEGSNKRIFGLAPPRSQMELCNIHFHKSAEHKGGEFTKYAGNGNGEGLNTGYQWNGELEGDEATPYHKQVCTGEGPEQSVAVGETIEIHWVFSSSEIEPGASLQACMDEDVMNPTLRVEGQVAVLVNDRNALDFQKLTEIRNIDGYEQAIGIPSGIGEPVQYMGSTTGPKYNEKGSAIKATWSIRPSVVKIDIASVDKWCKSNVFKEDYAHKVRNLVINPALLSVIN